MESCAGAGSPANSQHQVLPLAMDTGTPHLRAALGMAGNFQPPLVAAHERHLVVQATNMNPQSSVSKCFENRELNVYFKTLMFQTS